MKIGFFDSGVGGLTILHSVRENMTEYDYVFYGDTENIPYGDKTEDEIYYLTKQGIEKLFNNNVLLAIVACNTASAETLKKLQDTYLKEEHPERKVLGVIIPTIETLIDSQVHKALLIGTRRTIESKKFEKELQKINSNVSIIGCATPELVPLIEIGELAQALSQAKAYIDPRVGEIDSVILGCTHYTLLKDRLRALYPNLLIISQDEFMPEKILNYLERHSEIKSKLTRGSTLEVILSKESEYYTELKKSLL